jgi:hypothetical protein
MGNVLKKTATSRINEYQKRLSEANRLYEPIFRDLIVGTFDRTRAHKTVAEFLCKESFKFVAIDGTEYSRPLYDMIVFFAGAYSSEGSMTFSDNKIQINYENKSLQQGNDLSSCVPIYVDKIPEIDNSLTSHQGEESEGSWIPNKIYPMDNDKTLIVSYQPSRRNTNTGTLTRPMWINIFEAARVKLNND